MAGRRAAGAALESVLAPTGLPVTLSSAQSATATSAVLSRLASLGLGRAKLASLLGDIRVASPNDWLFELGS
jgi:hypothetical protein